MFATFLGTDPILVGGTPEQRKEWLGRIAEQGILLAYAATEPEAGSDLGAMKTTATPVETDGQLTGYRLTGRKQWISNGSIADVYSVLALAPGGPSWFIVETGTAGFATAPPEDKHGIRLSNTAGLFLDDVVVPAENLIGREEGRGLVQAQQVFGYTRVMVAAFGLGGGWEALDRAIAYSQTRIQGGAPLSAKQGFTHKLIVPHAVRLEAARAFLEAIGQRIDTGEGVGGALNTEGAVAKYMATEAGNAAADASDPGPWRLWLHPAVPGRKDQAGRADHDHLRGHLRDPGDDDRPRPVAAAPEDVRRRTTTTRRAASMACTRGLRRSHRSAGARLFGCGAWRPAGSVGSTRNQHVLLRLGELVAYAECAGALARRAQAAAAGALPDKADKRFEPARARRGQQGLRARRRRTRSPRTACGGWPGRARAQTWPPPCRWSGYGARRPVCSPT